MYLYTVKIIVVYKLCELYVTSIFEYKKDVCVSCELLL